MAGHPLDPVVSALMRRVAADIVLPRFGHLAHGEVLEKSPGDVVTIADREAEQALTEGLVRLLPHARVIGEEAVAADEGLLAGIDTGLAWIVDPIDGTSNYAAGRSPFALMVALVENGVTQAGWILDPVIDRMCHAALGGGAWIDGARVRTTAATRLPVAALGTRYLPEDLAAAMTARSAGRLTPVEVPHAAGEQYPRLMLGENDVALFWRALPWDHAAGALILTEAGGCVKRFDGTPYAVGQTGTGLLAAATPDLWRRAITILLG